VRRAARLERARSYLRMREYEAAESTLRALEWERPITRMELSTGLLLIEVFHRRGELQIALAHARRLLAVAPAGPQQADLLLKKVEICRTMGLNNEAEAARLRLEAEYPYSEAAALLQGGPVSGKSNGGPP
jgi:Tfp pilus assembly protein PilF